MASLKYAIGKEHEAAINWIGKLSWFYGFNFVFFFTANLSNLCNVHVWARAAARCESWRQGISLSVCTKLGLSNSVEEWSTFSSVLSSLASSGKQPGTIWTCGACTHCLLSVVGGHFIALLLSCPVCGRCLGCCVSVTCSSPLSVFSFCWVSGGFAFSYCSRLVLYCDLPWVCSCCCCCCVC